MTDPTPTPKTLGDKINRLEELKLERAEIARTDKDLKAEYDDLEAQVLAQLKEYGITQSRGTLATATISEITVPTIESWDKFEQYVKDNDAFYMLEKRVSGASFRELIAQGETIPGLKPFVKTSLSLRKI
jgi:hypothetical protein